MIPSALAALVFTLGASACAPDEENDDGHGVVRVRLARTDGQSQDPFAGTASVRWQVDYDRTDPRCLLEFYLNTDTSFQQGGVDGEPIFADWLESDYVCDRDFNPSTPECEIDDDADQPLEQFFSGNSAMDPSVRGNLRQTLTVMQDDLEGREIAIGPLPKRELLRDSCAPLVTFQDSGLQGFDAAGNVIWRVSSTRDRDMITDQGAAALAEISRAN